MMRTETDPDVGVPVEQLSDAELRRQLANVDMMLREADERGTPPGTVRALRERLDQLEREATRRGERLS
jgi:hypothetical protein